MKYVKIYILFILTSLVAAPSYGYDKDTLNIDKNSPISINRLDENFKSKYTESDFDYINTVADNPGIWTRFKEWLGRWFMRLFDVKTSQKTENYVSFFIKTLYVLTIIFVVYLIVKTILKREGFWIFGRTSDQLDITSDNLEIDLLETNFKELIEAATHANNYRLATRYYYLNTLKKLTNKALIVWDPDKTNYDYYIEIKDKEIQKQFQYISYLYNYSWYGEFELDSVAFSEIETAFNSLFKMLK